MCYIYSNDVMTTEFLVIQSIKTQTGIRIEDVGQPTILVLLVLANLLNNNILFRVAAFCSWDRRPIKIAANDMTADTFKNLNLPIE